MLLDQTVLVTETSSVVHKLVTLKVKVYVLVAGGSWSIVWVEPVNSIS